MADKPKLLEFYGEECPHCVRMAPLVEKLEKELGVIVEKYEVWHDEKNAELMKKYDTSCGGVPFYFNQTTSQSICGEVPYELFKEWAQA